jgi:hypothetical protein
MPYTQEMRKPMVTITRLLESPPKFITPDEGQVLVDFFLERGATKSPFCKEMSIPQDQYSWGLEKLAGIDSNLVRVGYSQDRYYLRFIGGVHALRMFHLDDMIIE